METTLMNFRIPTDLKIIFNSICINKNTKMTNELNKLIEEYINQEKGNLYPEFLYKLKGL